MAAVVWSNPTSRIFETGLDRGMLYVDEDNGVPWEGLVSIEENSEGEKPQSYYIDGFKYLVHHFADESTYNLSAFYSPEEFDECDGSSEMISGLSIKNQIRKEFSLSYRSRLGNGTEGLDFGYKIHLIYNATASPSEGIYSTLSDSVDVEPLSWDMVTRPVLIRDQAPSSHFVIDSTKISPGNMQAIEEVLYGSDSAQPRIPNPNEIVAIIASVEGVEIDAFVDIFREVF